MNKKEKVRKIFLENLPVYKDGKNKGKVDWKNTIGYDVSFVYDDIKGYISIVKYEKGKITIAYKNEIFWDKPISIGSLRECNLGYYLKNSKAIKEAGSSSAYLKSMPKSALYSAGCSALLGAVLSGAYILIDKIKNSKSNTTKVN